MKAPYLHSRQKNLLSVLNKKKGAVSGKNLATALDVSERTIRSDIKDINSKLSEYGIQICPFYGKGYNLSIKDRHLFIELFSERENYASKDDRVRTLMIRLLHENDWCELGILEDEMFVSRTTLENDLKTVKKKISARHPYLQMERKGNFVRLENNEIKRRDILIRTYAEYWDYDSREGILLKSDEFSSGLLRAIQNSLVDVVAKYSLHFDDSAFIYLVLSIAIMFYRVKGGNTVGYGDHSRPDSDISPAITELIAVLNNDWALNFSRAEYIWLSDILRQLTILSDNSRSKNKALENTDVLCHHIVNNLLRSIYEIYGVDYTNDDYFFIDLTLHVQALFDGIVAPQIQNHVLGDELRIKYPFVGDITNYSRVFLEKQCEIELGLGEEDYLLPLFISAHRTLSNNCKKAGIKTGIISHTNNSITLYLMNQLNSHYKDELVPCGPYPIHSKHLVADDDPYMILSTVHANLTKFTDAPVLLVSPLLEREDRQLIDMYISRFLCKNLFGDLPREASYYFRKDLIYTMNNKESLVTTLSAIKDLMHSKRYISNLPAPDLSKSYHSLLKNSFLFFYQIDDSISSPVISLVTLNKNISWKQLRSVQTIMYLVLPSTCRNLLGWFYFYARVISIKPDMLESILDDSF